MDFKNYLREQGELHPAMEPQDVMKMTYQASFGAEHLLEDTEAAKKYFMTEYDSVTADSRIPLFEDISEDMCRANLSAWKAAGLPAEWLFNMFVVSAGRKMAGSEDFVKYLQKADEEILRGGLDFGYEEWSAYKTEYLKDDIRAVHHSPRYREAEKPAYRLVHRCFTRLMPVLERAVKLRENAGNGPVVIAIDGRAASGKTTMAGMLSQVLGGEIISMDDFFLPPQLRTAERFSQPGGNVHYERFIEEVLPYIRKGEAFGYRRFDCGVMDFAREPVTVGMAQWIIVEGSYSHHPQLGKYADMKVFSSVETQVQRERIINRNGREMAEIFRSRWIPLEEEYFRALGIAEKADVTV